MHTTENRTDTQRRLTAQQSTYNDITIPPEALNGLVIYIPFAGVVLNIAVYQDIKGKEHVFRIPSDWQSLFKKKIYRLSLWQSTNQLIEVEHNVNEMLTENLCGMFVTVVVPHTVVGFACAD